ncbi:MAG: hypothetical protein R3F33_10430 [Planctomycetota bacterium]
MIRSAILILPFAWLSAPVLAQSTWYVDASATAPGAGTLANPWTTVTEALAQTLVVDGDTVLVAPGHYFNEAIDFAGKAVTVQGTAGAANTILHGQAPPGGGLPIRPVVWFTNGEGPNSQLSGFTLRDGHGYQTDPASPQTFGGNLYIASASPTLTDLRFEANAGGVSRGGAAYSSNSTVEYSNCIFTGFGGGVLDADSGGALAADSAVGVTNCVFLDVSARLGGAIAVYGGQLTVAASEFRQCTATTWFGGAIYHSSGIAAIDGSSFLDNASGSSGGALDADQAYLTNCSFVGNTAGLFGLGDGGGVSAGLVFATDCRFDGNSAPSGGGAYALGTSVFDRCMFTGNLAHGFAPVHYGGALHTGSLVRSRHCIFAGNSAIAAPGQLAAGGATYNGQYESCTFYGNEAPLGAGPAASHGELDECIAHGNRDPQGIVDQLANSTANHCLVQGGWPGSANLDAPPLFWDALGGDFHLQPGSPAIDAGAAGGIPDPDGTARDLGALTFDPAWCGEGCPGALGTSYCVANPNSTGQAAVVAAYGYPAVADNALVLTVQDLPPSQFGYFLMGSAQGFLPGFGGSDGNLCLAGLLVRLNDRIELSSTAGTAARLLDLPSRPQITAGTTWHFQYWTRDQNAGFTSNTSDAVTIQFL